MKLMLFSAMLTVGFVSFGDNSGIKWISLDQAKSNCVSSAKYFGVKATCKVCKGKGYLQRSQKRQVPGTLKLVDEVWYVQCKECLKHKTEWEAESKKNVEEHAKKRLEQLEKQMDDEMPDLYKGIVGGIVSYTTSPKQGGTFKWRRGNSQDMIKVDNVLGEHTMKVSAKYWYDNPIRGAWSKEFDFILVTMHPHNKVSSETVYMPETYWKYVGNKPVFNGGTTFYRVFEEIEKPALKWR